MAKKYEKPFLDLDAQVRLLRSRGLLIESEEDAKRTLSALNYYRMSAYFYYFQVDKEAHTFHEGVSFHDVKDLYNFDQELRFLMMEALSCIEIAVRTAWAYYVAQNYGAHGFLSEEKIKSAKHLAENIKDLEITVDGSREYFIEHYRKNYGDPELPPVWSVCEVMSFGQLSRWYANMKPACRAKKAISYKFGFHEEEFEGVLEHLVYVRNICSHHGRLWNKSLAVKKLPDLKVKPKDLRRYMQQDDGKFSLIYNTIIVVLFILEQARSSPPAWRERLIATLERHAAYLHEMGSRDDWRALNVFRAGA